MSLFAWVLNQPALWGFLGAFIYAAPNLIVCVFEARSSGGSSLRCWLEFVVALMVGTIAAAAFSPALHMMWSLGAREYLTGIATMIGLTANVVAPKIVRLAPDAIEQRMSRILKVDSQ